MRKIFLVILSFVAITATSQESTAVVRIGYIDKALFVSAMPEMKAAQEKLRQLQADYEAEFNSMTDVYNERIRLYLEKDDTMTEAIKLARQTEITELELTIDLYKRRYLADLDFKRHQLETPVYQAVDAAIKAVAQTMGLTIVFDQATPLFVSDQCVDITDAVAAQLAQ